MFVTQSCPVLCNPLDYSSPGSSVHGILQARILEWVAILFSRGSSWLRGWTCICCIAGRFYTIWAAEKALEGSSHSWIPAVTLLTCVPIVACILITQPLSFSFHDTELIEGDTLFGHCLGPWGLQGKFLGLISVSWSTHIFLGKHTYYFLLPS